MTTTDKRPRSLDDKQEPMLEDIRMLGNMLGQIIREQEGDAGFDLIEEVRHAAIDRRQGEEQARDRLNEMIQNTSLHEKQMLIKAFGNYLQLTNIAEDLQRIRTLRRRERERGVSDSIARAVHDLHKNGMTAAEMRALLAKLRVRLVLTAHPSEAKRQEILIKLRDIADMMTLSERSDLLPREQDTVNDDIIRRIEQLWQTQPNRAARATVMDEVQFGIYFLTSAIMDVVVEVYEHLRERLSEYYDDEDWSDLPSVLRYSSWIGGDRDGNPNVTPDVTLQTFKTMRDAVRRVYMDVVAYVRDRLTQATSEIEDVPELLERWPNADSWEPPYPGEIYRKAMNDIYTRLENDDYSHSDDLLHDLQLVSRSLRRHRSKHSAEGTLNSLILKVQLFGLYLVPLDVREDARLYIAAVTEMFRHYDIADDFESLPEDRKQEILRAEIRSPRPLFPVESHFSETTNRVIGTWQMIAKAHRLHGTAVIDSVIASMSRHPSDVLIMLMFAKEVGVSDNVDIVPLFETVEDLQNAPEIMETLFNMPEYHAHLQNRLTQDGLYRQQIMIGYSDSNKDGGYIAANWSLYEAQRDLADKCKALGVSLELFHGRGGSIGRGGGPTNRALRSQPPESMHGEVKITEQGEVIAYRYSNKAISWRHLNQVMHAMMMVLGAPTHIEVKPEWKTALDYLSEAGRSAYRSFVYENDGFLDYWQQATPINELARMPIGSRPAKRKKGGFESIRAIPWVFSWMQSRAIIPSWYGVGHAFETFCQQDETNMDVLREMYESWPFFRALIENVELDVAKADMEIAELYANLVQDEDTRQRIFADLSAEHQRTWDHICAVTGQTTLLEKSAVMQRSISGRNPYVDPLNFIQVELLRKLRSLDPDTEEYNITLQEVLSTVNGIAAGMKTTG